MMKSILSLFGSLGGMIVKVMLAIASVVLTAWCAFTALTVQPFLWQGALRLAGAVAGAALFVSLVKERGNKEDEAPDRDEGGTFR